MRPDLFLMAAQPTRELARSALPDAPVVAVRPRRRRRWLRRPHHERSAV